MCQNMFYCDCILEYINTNVQNTKLDTQKHKYLVLQQSLYIALWISCSGSFIRSCIAFTEFTV